MLLIICLNLAIGFLPRVDNSAHIGGFVSGLLAGFVLLMRPQYGYISSKHVPEGYQIKHKVAKHQVHQVKWERYVRAFSTFRHGFHEAEFEP
ncbi:hypothetical protein GOBAR_DD36780 [Gossypium barbadense]|nr:hypothetical protein GOBAR_DD36780 [Gossypium barbadense]